MSTQPDRIRLDKYLAHATGLSRKQARSLIRQGQITVDGECQTRLDAHIAVQATVLIDGQPCRLPGYQYVMLNKPAEVICSTEDGHNTTVLDLLGATGVDLHCAGRLDKDTTGLVLLSNDGQWTHRVTSPRHAHEKCYRVWLAQPVLPHYHDALQQGLLLHGEAQPTRPARMAVEPDGSVLLWITEGRYHQVKRMFAALDNQVTRLHREAIGALALDTSLAPGDWRALTATEIDLF